MSLAPPDLAPETEAPLFDSYAETYDEVLDASLAASGETKDYFARRRMHWLAERLQRLGHRPTDALDFGCGTGTSLPLFFELLSCRAVTGLDVSEASLDTARRRCAALGGVALAPVEEHEPAENFDLAFTNGVFHHITPGERADAARHVFESLRPGGLFAFWENNPWNPGARWCMATNPFDRDAVMLSPPEARRLLREAGFEIVETTSVFYFPRVLQRLRPLEPLLARAPLGAQYLVLARKPQADAQLAPTNRAAWLAALVGLMMAVFAIVALSSPGRIDVVDGHTRYEVGRSLVEHGDSIVRDPDTWFYVFPGRGGQRYTNYRLPHSLQAAAAIIASDLTGPVREIRRHFFFSLSGAAVCALIAAIYAAWFRRLGHSPGASLAWAAGGILCTPTWFYGTTAFDDALGSLLVLAAVFAAYSLRERRPMGAAVVSGLLLGIAFNCKPPLALFMPAAVAALWSAKSSKEERSLQARAVFFCTALGAIGYELYELWKFPPSVWAALAKAREEYVNLWPGNPLAGFLSLLVSPGMGAIWYWPALALAAYGLAEWRLAAEPKRCPGRPWGDLLRSSRIDPDDLGRSPHEFAAMRRQFVAMVGLSSLAYLAFIATIRFYSGEPAWGPRYLTPIFALLWVVVPVGAARLGWRKSAALLAASFMVQVAGLSVETMRFFSSEREPAAECFLKFVQDPWVYFRPGESQLLARPGQAWNVLTYDGPPATAFTAAKSPTSPLFVNLNSKKPLDPQQFHVLNSLRPWWIAYRYLPPIERPVDLDAARAVLLWSAAIGILMLAAGVWLCMEVQPKSGARRRLPKAEETLLPRAVGI